MDRVLLALCYRIIVFRLLILHLPLQPMVNTLRNQFIEFSVNLTKLGLDPVTTFGTDVCGTPFNRLVVKTRASASFHGRIKGLRGANRFVSCPKSPGIS